MTIYFGLKLAGAHSALLFYFSMDILPSWQVFLEFGKCFHLTENGGGVCGEREHIPTQIGSKSDQA